MVTYSDLQAGTQLVKDYSELIKSRFVLEAVIEQLNLPLSYEQLSDKVTVSTPADTRVISIAVTDSNPVTAMKIANAIRETASTHIRNVMDIETVNIVETANVPTHKASPSARKNTGAGRNAWYPDCSSHRHPFPPDERYDSDGRGCGKISWNFHPCDDSAE